jgi:hypothetical protein
MRTHTGFLIASALLSLGTGPAFALEPYRLAQAAPDPGIERERAPGVPLAPNPGAVGQRERAIGEPSTVAPRRAGQRPGVQSEADRTLPMPRGVPSIIAP